MGYVLFSMEWNERELAWLNKRRNFIETHDFTDIRIELSGETALALHEKRHLVAGIAIATGLEILIEIDPVSLVSKTTRTRLVVVDPNGGKQRLALNDYGVKPELASMKKDYSSDLKDIGCSQKLISEIMSNIRTVWR